ncbi:MAG: hypothetical protein COV10_01305 [Candidatus Vogelbacteria bacterium CG10_big_fil_rev_8_21_14_0_10_51_16]|uniref:Nucleotidyl transferase AbiEii/AbiGii toxin family protein n=1 Tax=Candidatus Vogelbacteria bacterium CG10_big_fil_rev_8_21_14_0_10_51_16 TaxID=1975045 RepID=A0A2H0RF66_9BACT|nr:MAG: hypothetical protein COV10_01305 [Candidatus Vogelbacteria bacterium CG10_big_fil_rev_8_21_14_0_10_51_16]
MHTEILTREQVDLLPVIKKFGEQFGMVGGTAIALHIGHRESIDFDLFSEKEFRNSTITSKIKKLCPQAAISYEDAGQINLKVGEVKLTFYHYPYPVRYSEHFEDIINIPDLLSLAAMKVFAMGQRAKWKDYVDLYFILRDYHTIDDVTERAKELFGAMYNEKLCRVQLAYFEDIDYREPVVYRPGFEVEDGVVKDALTEFSLAG